MLPPLRCQVSVIDRMHHTTTCTCHHRLVGLAWCQISGDDLPAVVLRSEDSVAKAFDDASDHFDILHGVVTCAGIVRHSHTTPLVDITTEEFDETCAINLRGSFLSIKHAARHARCLSLMTVCAKDESHVKVQNSSRL
jgi:NAD(P)-dependent dehydrogenase (short-subunit alcohol dehydrogenase family)